jgi:hypothetical protein
MFPPVFTGSRNLHVIIVAALAAFFSFSAVASEPVADEAPVAAEVVAPTTDGNIVVTPIPMPASVIELATTAKPVVKLRSAKGSKLAKNRPLPKMMLSRTERHQMALLAPKPKNGEQAVPKHLEGQNGETGYDELALHGPFSRPRLVSESDDEDTPDAVQLSGPIKLRLFIARMRAVEAHALAQVADTDDDLSDTIKLRLANARMIAVQAHQKRFT